MARHTPLGGDIPGRSARAIDKPCRAALCSIHGRSKQADRLAPGPHPGRGPRFRPDHDRGRQEGEGAPGVRQEGRRGRHQRRPFPDEEEGGHGRRGSRGSAGRRGRSPAHRQGAAVRRRRPQRRARRQDRIGDRGRDGHLVRRKESRARRRPRPGAGAGRASGPQDAGPQPAALHLQQHVDQGSDPEVHRRDLPEASGSPGRGRQGQGRAGEVPQPGGLIQGAGCLD